MDTPMMSKLKELDEENRRLRRMYVVERLKAPVPLDVRVVSVVWFMGPCYSLFAMRTVLSALLAFIVVFQSSWALAAPYCQHERTIPSAHFGHHEHEHQALTAAASGDTGEASAAQSPAGADVDCSACDASSPAIVLSFAHALTAPRQSERVTRPPTAPPAAFSAGIERPNWPVLA